LELTAKNKPKLLPGMWVRGELTLALEQVDWQAPAVAIYALTIFTGAFLLFQVQPLIGKYILPWFGGGPGVWTTSMLFFQVLLLGGYAYAHCISRWLKPRSQVVVHLVLLAAALTVLPITPSDAWKPGGQGNPVLEILLLLAVSLGLPYLVLSSTGPLMQQWFSSTNPGVSPYRLYALSNAGSLLALVSYPFYFETHFTHRTQAALWGWGLAAYAVACGWCAIKAWRSEVRRPKAEGNPKSEGSSPKAKASPHHAAANNQPGATARVDSSLHNSDLGPRTSDFGLRTPSPLTRLLWLMLPACASVLLLATTNKLCQDLAVVPFLWVLPLALYLLSFVICFDHPRWYARFAFTLTLIVAFGGTCWAIYRGNAWPIGQLIAVYSGALFVFCMVCHGELYRLKPEPNRLTEFYLMIAAGGALGGLLVAVVAPAVFTGYYELHFGILFCALLLVVVCLCGRDPAEASHWRRLSGTLPLVALAGLGWLLAYLAGETGGTLAGCFAALLAAVGIFFLLLLERAVRVRKSGKPAAGIWALALAVFAPWAVPHRQVSARRWRVGASAWMMLGVATLGAVLWAQRERYGDKVLSASRNFYGVLRVLEHIHEPTGERLRWLVHGRIAHGYELLAPAQADAPTLYYSENSGVGLALAALPPGGRRIGAVGLGVGTLAAYAQPGDDMRFYEINPEVSRLARSQFSYLAHCRGRVEVVQGDARLSLEREPPQGFDALVLDAFNSDAIPVHLLTAEAFEVYARQLKTNGILALHISNNYLDLEPVLANLARRFNYSAVAIDHAPTEGQWWLRPSRWVLLSRNEEVINAPAIHSVARPLNGGPDNAQCWTDDFSSLFQVLR
jgi:SAM-dependent methyltransferase